MRELRAPSKACCICHRQAPYSAAFYSPGNLLSLRVEPSLHGWMIVYFPWMTPIEGTSQFESYTICPECGSKVASYINYLKTPMLDDNDL